MGALIALLALAALVAVIVGIVMLAVNSLRKRPVRTWGIMAISGFIVFVIMIVLTPESDSPSDGNLVLDASGVAEQASDSTEDIPVAPEPGPLPTLTPDPMAAATPIPAESITIKQLKAEYDANQIAADNRFEGRTLEVHGGVIDNISRDFLDNPYVTLGTGEILEFWSMSCSFRDESQILELHRGQIVAIRGTNGGMSFGTVEFEDCEVVG